MGSKTSYMLYFSKTFYWWKTIRFVTIRYVPENKQVNIFDEYFRHPVILDDHEDNQADAEEEGQDIREDTQKISFFLFEVEPLREGGGLNPLNH